MGTTDELKKKMSVPPIPQQVSRSSKSHKSRDRSRVRMEISRDQCVSFMEMLSEKLKTLPIEGKEFKNLYGVWWALKQQRDKFSSTEESNGK